MPTGGIIGGLAKAGLSLGASKLFGGNRGETFTPAPLPSINAGGFRGEGGRIRITPERAALTNQLSGLFTGQADRISELVGPGLEGLRSVRLNQINDAARRSIGNLRENLQRRRVIGSSFGQDALARAELEAGRERSRAEAQTFLEGIQFIEQESNLRRQAVDAQLSDLNAAADIGLALSGRASTQLQQNATIKAELAAKEARASGQFFGQISRPVINSIGDAVGGFFGGGSTGVRTDAAGRILGGI